MNRRKTKNERELVADMHKGTMIFCNKQKNCKSCPLTSIKDSKDVGCMVAYLIYILNEESVGNESDM